MCVVLGGVEKALERRQLEKGRPGDMGLVSSGTHIHTHTGKRCVPTEKAFSFFEEKEANILGKYKKRDEGEEEEEEKGRKKVARTNVKNVKESSRPRFLPPAFSP